MNSTTDSYRTTAISAIKRFVDMIPKDAMSDIDRIKWKTDTTAFVDMLIEACYREGRNDMDATRQTMREVLEEWDNHVIKEKYSERGFESNI